jgi:ADP-ribose 1''-phosphate phosphatase
MPSTRDSSIASDFQPTTKGKSKEMGLADHAGTSSSNNDLENTALKSQTKAKSKRPLSGTPPAPTPYQGPSSLTVKTLRLICHTGDIFASAPPATLLIHACNTRGHWGAGIAKAFKDLYPAAYNLHHDFCTKSPHSKSIPVPTGTAQLIPPADPQGHWIGCLFTSAGYGRKKDGEQSILTNTGLAMEMLLELVRRAEEEGEMRIGEARMCRINSGKFGVEWARSEAVLKEVVVREGWKGEVEVWSVE